MQASELKKIYPLLPYTELCSSKKYDHFPCFDLIFDGISNKLLSLFETKGLLGMGLGHEFR
jgi:hypothetical protein